MSYASTGPGSASHLTGELFAKRVGADMLHVPYKGGAPAMHDLLAGRFTGYFAAPPTALPHVEAGKLMPLATTGLTRPPYLPNIPTVAESGLPGFEALNWYAFVASSKTPTADPRPLQPGDREGAEDPEVRSTSASTAWRRIRPRAPSWPTSCGRNRRSGAPS